MIRKNECDHTKYFHIQEIIILIFRGMMPIILLGGGLFLIDLRGLSLILGFPMTVLGVAFLIFTYDEIASMKVGGPPKRFFGSKFVRCSVCGKQTPRVPGEWEEDTICPKCKKDRLT